MTLLHSTGHCAKLNCIHLPFIKMLSGDNGNVAELSIFSKLEVFRIFDKLSNIFGELK